MKAPSYIATNPDELFERAPEDIKSLLKGPDVDNATAILGKLYKLPVNLYVPLENIISFILIGALKPEDAVRAIMETLHLSEEESLKLAEDMEKSILEKARIRILGKSPEDMVTLTFQEGRSAEDLRTEILDTTKRDSVFAKADETQVAQDIAQSPSTKGPILPSGSRSQLLDQLQVLDTIPNDDEIAERLKKIQEQISGMSLANEAFQAVLPDPRNFVPNQGENIVVEVEQKPASYSKAPTKYNVDPYREVLEA